MPVGLLTGLGAAICWGTLDLFAALASRRVGSLRVTTGMQLVGAAFIWLAALATGTTLPADPFVLIGGALVGLAGAGAYLSYFTGLRIGPIAVVSGMVAAYGGLTVVLAVVIRGETLTPLQALGATVATLGVVLTGISFDQGLRGTRFASPGVVFAVVALILFATMSIGSDIVIDRAPWLEVLLVARTANAIVSVVVLVVALTALRAISAPMIEGVEGDDGGGRMDPRVLGAIVLSGVLDIIGLMSFAYGLEHAETWLVGLASSFGPAVTIVVAVALLGERLRPIQWVGLGGILVRDDRDRIALGVVLALLGRGVVGGARECAHQDPQQAVQLLPVLGAQHRRELRFARGLCPHCPVPDVVTGFRRLHERSPSVVRIGQAANEPGSLHPVEPVGHRAAREAHVLGQLSS